MPTPAADALAAVLSLRSDRAAAVFDDLRKRQLIRQEVGSANDMGETGQVKLIQTRWIRGDVATTLELVRALTALDWMAQGYRKLS